MYTAKKYFHLIITDVYVKYGRFYGESILKQSDQASFDLETCRLAAKGNESTEAAFGWNRQ
jgi:hypothetical protein